ncbi:MAG: valine--tRNA ligase [Candidatus Levybacteria bacterium]|nr:valine--tRNA ligase [Candidatus Levybacteria bacterium]
MDKVYNHKGVEEKLYQQWEKAGYFTPKIDPSASSGQERKPFTIILPPPNANAPLHFGHAMYVVEDILIRYHRMKGDPTLWLPGADHAGFETQFVFEKQLEKKGKSRFDYDRATLYQMIWDYVQENRKGMENQLRRLGFSLDWTRTKFTLDKDIVQIVHKTFKKMYDGGLIYRGERLVNYCTHCGTSFSDLEVVYEERQDPLYYIKYGPLVLATTRPETKFGDTGIAVNPKDKRYQKLVGKEVEIETVLGKAIIRVVADDAVDPEFGTGVVKITPSHDFNDFEIAQRHNLSMKQVIGFDGKMNEHAGKFAGMYVKQARKAIIEEMQQKGLIEKIDDKYIHRIGLCYKCKNVLEPLPLEQWFVRMEPLAKRAIEVVKKGKIKFYPQRHEKTYLNFLENIRDWNISRQIVWGIRIPAWRCQKCKNQKLKSKNTNQNAKIGNNEEMEQSTNNGWVVTDGTKPEKCPNCGSAQLEQDEDTFDTWFSSAQWPFATLQTAKEGDFGTFYPTTVLETMYDILLFWVARMVMVGLYVTGEIPFQNVVLHGMVKDPLGKKMSKSKGNVVDPLEIVEQYGADAVRFALVYGTAFGNDQSLSYPKLEAMRKFTNKLWNMGRFIAMKRIQNSKFKIQNSVQEILEIATHKNDKTMVKRTQKLIKEITEYLDGYQFNYAAERLYDFVWHEFADKYIEDVKKRIDDNSSLILNSLFIILLKLLHPFTPFVTEEIYQQLKFEGSLMMQPWPK